MKRKVFNHKGLVLILLFASLSLGSVTSATEKLVSYDSDNYEVVKSYTDSQVHTSRNHTNFEISGSLTNLETGGIIGGEIESINTQKLYDLVHRSNGEPASHYRTDVVISSSEHRTSGNASDDGLGLVFSETIYYTVHNDGAFDYVSINKIDYRFDIKDSSYRVGAKRMEIHQNGMGIDGYAKSNQTKGVNLNDSGTILPKDYAWTPVNHPALASRVGTKTTATIQRGQTSSWEFSYTLNPR